MMRAGLLPMFTIASLSLSEDGPRVIDFGIAQHHDDSCR
jgi:hypothetical protein